MRPTHNSLFPTHTATDVPGILNAPWKLNSDRKNIIGGEWNTALMDEAAGLVADTLPKLSSPSDPGRLLDAFPRQLGKDEDAVPLVEGVWKAIEKAFGWKKSGRMGGRLGSWKSNWNGMIQLILGVHLSQPPYGEWREDHYEWLAEAPAGSRARKRERRRTAEQRDEVAALQPSYRLSWRFAHASHLRQFSVNWACASSRLVLMPARRITSDPAG